MFQSISDASPLRPPFVFIVQSLISAHTPHTHTHTHTHGRTTYVVSNPALSASCRGMISIALANAAMISCCFPISPRERSRSARITSISAAPPPETIFVHSMQRFTMQSESQILRCASSRNWSAPPRRMMVEVTAVGQPLKMLYRYRKMNCQPQPCVGSHSVSRGKVVRCRWKQWKVSGISLRILIFKVIGPHFQ